ncbi:MAG: hypothetical protein WDM88_07065 [Galbitalea sp.]
MLGIVVVIFVGLILLLFVRSPKEIRFVEPVSVEAEAEARQASGWRA